MDAIFDTVGTGHQHRGKSEIGVCRRVGKAHLDAFAGRVKAVRNAAGRTAITL
jgi:hypothetical protein